MVPAPGSEHSMCVCACAGFGYMRLELRNVVAEEIRVDRKGEDMHRTVYG